MFTLTLKEQYEKEKRSIINDAVQLESASDYTKSYLKHGSSCDSSDRSQKRIHWVHKAEEEFLNNHKKEILSLAAEMCRDSIGE